MATDRASWPSVNIAHREFDLDGVLVHHFPTTEPAVAVALCFGVGSRDETLPTVGTLHALEHLVMDTVRKTPIEINAQVGHSITEFTAEGSPALVAAFLEGVCRALSDPPLDRLATETAVLEAEGAGDEGGDPLLLARYGWRDLALAGAPGPGPRGITADAVRETARTWFVDVNAVLVVDGPWPEGLGLPLAGGSKPRRIPVEPRHWDRPHAVTAEGPACALSLILPPAAADGVDLVAIEVLENRVTEILRHQRGLTYDVDVAMASIPDRRWDLSVEIEPLEERIGEAIRTAIQVTGELLASGPTEEEVAAARSAVIEAGRGRNGQIATVQNVALGHLQGGEVPPLDPDVVATVSSRAVAELFRASATDVLYLIDETLEAEVEAMGIPVISGEPETAGPLPAGEVFRPPLLAMAVSKEARSARVVLGPDCLAMPKGASRSTSIRWSEVAGVRREEEGTYVVFGLDGAVIPVGPLLYKNGSRLVDAVRAHVPDELCYDAPASAVRS